MSMLAFSRIRAALCLTVLALLACSGSRSVAPVDRSTTTVVLLNDGAVVLTDIRILTSDKDSLPVVAALSPGRTVGPYAVSVLHTNPFVVAKIQGRSVVAHPIEGFSGFNPPRAPGAYVISLRAASELTALDVRVTAGTP